MTGNRSTRQVASNLCLEKHTRYTADTVKNQQHTTAHFVPLLPVGITEFS